MEIFVIWILCTYQVKCVGSEKQDQNIFEISKIEDYTDRKENATGIFSVEDTEHFENTMAVSDVVYTTESCKETMSKNTVSANCSGLNLTQIPDNIGGYRNITQLDVSHNNITIINYMPDFAKLQSLDLSHNPLQSIKKEALWHLNLTWIALHHTALHQLHPLVFSGLPLAYIHIQRDSLSEVRSTIKTVNVSYPGNNSTVPRRHETYRLNLTDVRLQNLYADGLGISSWDTICDTDFRLVELSLNDNYLSYLPCDENLAGKLQALRKLYLENNLISGICRDFFKGMSNITHLKLTKNPLAAIDFALCEYRAKLLIFEADFTFIKTLDNDVFKNCTQLEKISIQYGVSLESVGSAFSNLPKLKTLLLGHNIALVLEHGAFENSTNITTLDMNRLGLAVLPRQKQLKSSIFNLSNLKNLNVDYGNYESFSHKDMKRIKQLDKFSGHNNPFECGCENERLIQWFKDTRMSNDVIPRVDRHKYKCSTCDSCEEVTTLDKYDLGHCYRNLIPTKYMYMLIVGIAALVGFLFGVLVCSPIKFASLRFSREPTAQPPDERDQPGSNEEDDPIAIPQGGNPVTPTDTPVDDKNNRPRSNTISKINNCGNGSEEWENGVSDDEATGGFSPVKPNNCGQNIPANSRSSNQRINASTSQLAIPSRTNTTNHNNRDIQPSEMGSLDCRTIHNTPDILGGVIGTPPEQLEPTDDAALSRPPSN